VNQAQAIALIQHLHPQLWMPKTSLPLGLANSLSFEIAQPMQVHQQPIVQPAECPVQPSIAKKIAPINQTSQRVLAANQVVVQQKPAVASPAFAPSLVVPAPNRFHVMATMIAAELGFVVNLSEGQTGLRGEDYVLLNNVITAVRRKLQLNGTDALFSAFRWPPARGVAQGLDSQTMGLGALKGFLHTMAHKKRCSWVVFDEQFAQFCFQQADFSQFMIKPLGDYKLLAAPSLPVLQANPALKKQLWQQLQTLVLNVPIKA